MKITVKYFAALKDERGLGEEQLEGTFNSPKDLYGFLKKEHDLSICVSKLKVAVNDEFANWDSSLNEGDSIVFIPPVAGG